MEPIDFAKKMALQAGEILLKEINSAFVVATKQNTNDLVTNADRLCEAFLVEQIQKQYPEHSILGEEGTGNSSMLSSCEWLWVLDPIDGTVNFSQKLPFYCISIALLKKGEPFMGVIYAPVLNELFFAVSGQGAFLNNEKIKVSATSSFSDCVLSTGFPYDKNTSEQNNLQNFTEIVPQIRGIRRMGAAALDLAYVACGRLDGYWEEKIKPWDIAAGILIIQEAGGWVSNFTNDFCRLNEGNIVATNGLLHQQLISNLAPYAQQFYPKKERAL